MLKSVGTVNGKRTVILGLSFGNLQKFRDEPGDTYIHVDGDEIGVDFDILIMSGRTEADLAAMLMPRLDKTGGKA